MSLGANLSGMWEGRNSMEFRLKALTPVWTGGVKRNDNSTLHLTGIKGSIRWWYEVLIRGLGGYACDPAGKNENEKCSFDTKAFQKTKDLSGELKRICPACNMFGCAGWSGKFNLRIKDEKGRIKREQIKADDSFVLEFVERKQFEQGERLLLQTTLKLIVDYGAIGGRTAFKPSEKSQKNSKLHHKDFGLIARDDDSSLPKKVPQKEIHEYLEPFKVTSTENNKKNNPEWPDLKNFWFVKGDYIKRDEHNQIVNRRDDNGKYIKPIDFQIFLGGYIPREQVGPENENASKKIFSFHGVDPNNDKYAIQGIRRCFGYVKENELDNVVNLIEGNVDRLKRKIKRGTEVLYEL